MTALALERQHVLSKVIGQSNDRKRWTRRHHPAIVASPKAKRLSSNRNLRLLYKLGASSLVFESLAAMCGYDALCYGLAQPEMSIGAIQKLLTFQPDTREVERGGLIETALFLGVRHDPPLETTQLRWQVRLHAKDIVQLESTNTYLENLGGALFLTTKPPPVETQPSEISAPIGWMKWIGEQGRRSFQIQLAISAAGFDRVCHLAEKGRYPDAIITFKDDGTIEHGLSPDGNKKIWNNVGSTVALISEFTLRYDLSLNINS